MAEEQSTCSCGINQSELDQVREGSVIVEVRAVTDKYIELMREIPEAAHMTPIGDEWEDCNILLFTAPTWKEVDEKVLEAFDNLKEGYRLIAIERRFGAEGASVNYPYFLKDPRNVENNPAENPEET